MKHRIGFNRLDRRQGHRKALKNNMVTSLFRYERVETTKSKALEVRRVAEKMVTRARVDSVHNRRIIGQRIHDQEVLAKLFTEIAPRYLERPGGYTRVLKTGFRQGDAAEMVILELVDRKIEEKKRPAKPKEEAAAAAESAVEAEETPSTISEAEESPQTTESESEQDDGEPEEVPTEDESPQEGEATGSLETPAESEVAGEAPEEPKAEDEDSKTKDE